MVMFECAVSVQKSVQEVHVSIYLLFPRAPAKGCTFLQLRLHLPDGTPMNRAGNAINHPETIGPDPHTPGSPLPRALFCNSVGYLPDGTPMTSLQAML